MPGTTTLNPLDARSWAQWVAQYDAVRQQFGQQFQNLQSLGTYVAQRHPEMLAQYNTFVAQGAQHQANLAALQSVRDTVTNWLSGLGQTFTNAVVNPLSTFFNTVEQDVQSAGDWLKRSFGFGAVPVIVGVVGVAAAAAVIVAVANWINQSYQMTQRLNALYRLEQSGSTPQQAANIVNQTLGSPGGSLFGIPMTWIFGGLALVLLGPLLVRQIGGRNGR